MLSLYAGKFREAAGAVIRMLAGRWIAGGSEGAPVELVGGLLRLIPLGDLILGWPLSAASFDGVRFDEQSGGAPGVTGVSGWEFTADDTAVYYAGQDGEGTTIQFPVNQQWDKITIQFDCYPGSDTWVPPSTLFIGPWAYADGSGEFPKTDLITTWPLGSARWYEILIEYDAGLLTCWADDMLRYSASVPAPLTVAETDIRLVWQALGYPSSGRVRNLVVTRGG